MDTCVTNLFLICRTILFLSVVVCFSQNASTEKARDQLSVIFTNYTTTDQQLIMADLIDGPVWQEDDEVMSCFACNNKYSFFKRRHHCRKCGRVVCGLCSDHKTKYFPNTIVVNEYGMKKAASPYETYRTCDECFEEVKMIRRALFGIDGQEESGESGESDRGSEGRVEDVDDGDSTTKYSTRTSTRLIRSSTSSLGDTNEGTSDRPRNRTRDLHLEGGVFDPRDDSTDSNLCPVCASNLLELYLHGHKHIAEITNEDFEKFKESHINDCLVAYDFNHDDNQRFNSPTARSHPVNKMLVFNMPPIPKPQFENIPDLEGSFVDTIRQGIDTHIGSVTSSSSIPEKSDFTYNYDNECVICLEDLKPGDKVARMECLCVFHYKCIKFWFKKKGFGECPVHFVHKRND